MNKEAQKIIDMFYKQIQDNIALSFFKTPLFIFDKKFDRNKGLKIKVKCNCHE